MFRPGRIFFLIDRAGLEPGNFCLCRPVIHINEYIYSQNILFFDEEIVVNFLNNIRNINMLIQGMSGTTLSLLLQKSKGPSDFLLGIKP